MASPQVLDIEALLEPIPGDNPAGEYLRYAGTYDAIGEARREDLPETDSIWKSEGKIADWRTVIDLTTAALQTKSKDLQIAVWLTEALVKRHGLVGLCDGLRLLRELHERFWDTLYPEIEDGDLEMRAGPLEWLNERLPLSIKLIPVTQSRGGVNYTFLDREESRRVDNLGLQNQEAMAAMLAEGKITGEQFDNAVTATPLPFYTTLAEGLAQSRAEYDALDAVVDEKFARDAPSLRGIKDTLQECLELVEGIVKKKQPAGRDEAPPQDGRGGRPLPGDGRPERGARVDQDGHSPESLPLEPLDRYDAFRRLEAVAAYFRRTEPHSPVPYAIELAVRWGELSLEAWLREVIKGEDVLGHVFERLGVHPAQENSDT